MAKAKISKPKSSSKPGLPTREQIIAFITESDQPAGKREIAREFGLKGNEKIALKALLKDMSDGGADRQRAGAGISQNGRRAQGYGAAHRQY